MPNEKPGCLGTILQALGLMSKQTAPINEIFPYALRDDFLSPSEVSFYRILKQVVGQRATVYVKVNLSDIFFVKAGDRRQKTAYQNKIDRKHVDFLICDKDGVKPVCAIELDDSSHQRQDRVMRDEFLNRVFDVAGLKLVRFVNKRSYTFAEIEAKLAPVFEGEKKAAVEVSAVDAQEIGVTPEAVVEGPPVCKKCGMTMVLRTAKKGDSRGQVFYGCSNYPRCRETVYLS